MKLLEITNLRVSFVQGNERIEAVRGIDLELNRGETFAIVGESGSGKSVTALSAFGLLGPNADISGSARFVEQELVGASYQELKTVLGNEVSFIFQEPMTSLNPLHTLEKQIGESLALHQGIQGKKARERILQLLHKVGIKEPEKRLSAYPHQLSGGQRQRVMIAMALANRPQLLIADEPTTALDVTIQAQILELLAELKESEGLSMLFITHDLALVRRFADRVAVMRQGEIVERGNAEEIFRAPQHEYTKMLLEAEQVGSPEKLPSDAKEILKTEELRIWFPIQRGLLKRTVDHVKAVNSASILLKEGETLGIVGESGSGKTTLSLGIMRLIESKGAIEFNGRDLRALRSKELRALRRDMQIVFQDPFGALSPRMTIEQIIAEGLEVHGLSTGSNRRKIVGDIMEEIGLDPGTMDRYPHEFSGGQRQRVAIARAMVLRPKLVVLDEPTSALDMTVQVSIVELLRELQSRYRLAYLFISHDLNVVRAMSHRVLVMKNGDVVETGDVDQIFDQPQTEYTRALMHAAMGN